MLPPGDATEAPLPRLDKTRSQAPSELLRPEVKLPAVTKPCGFALRGKPVACVLAASTLATPVESTAARTPPLVAELAEWAATSTRGASPETPVGAVRCSGASCITVVVEDEDATPEPNRPVVEVGAPEPEGHAGAGAVASVVACFLDRVLTTPVQEAPGRGSAEDACEILEPVASVFLDLVVAASSVMPRPRTEAFRLPSLDGLRKAFESVVALLDCFSSGDLSSMTAVFEYQNARIASRHRTLARLLLSVLSVRRVLIRHFVGCFYYRCHTLWRAI